MENKKLIIKAFTNSEWDVVSMAVLELSEQYINILKEVQKIGMSIKDSEEAKKLHFNEVSFFLNIVDFYYEEEPISEELDYKIVDSISEKSLIRPENALDTFMLKTNGEYFWFVCYGKHTGEEFWSESINFKEII